jgi:hypothetical protein
VAGATVEDLEVDRPIIHDPHEELFFGPTKYLRL